jgi:hypothetical protein
MLPRIVLCALGIAAALTANPLADSCQAKLHAIDSGQAKRGSVVVFTPEELNAWVQGKASQMVEGVRNPRLQLETGAATGIALVDFLKMRRSQGLTTNPFLERLLEGERTLKVSARLESGQGRATVYLTNVELAGIDISGSMLDYLVKNFLVPQFPDAKIDQPFELRDNIERIEIRPDAVRVFMKK